MTRLGPGEGIRRSARGSEMFFKAVGATTQGQFSLMERALPAGGRMPPAHRHVGTEEAYFVLEGEVEFHVGDEVFVGGKDTFVLVPSGVGHTFGNTSASPARVLVLHVPALDEYFRDLEQLWSRGETPTREEEVALMRRHSMEPT